jgi:hypothetical protein
MHFYMHPYLHKKIILVKSGCYRFLARSEEVELGRSTIAQVFRVALNVVVVTIVAITPSVICHLNSKG